MAAGTDVNGFNLDLIRIIQAQSQLITVDLQLHGISHGRQLHSRYLCSRYHPHIQKMLAQSACVLLADGASEGMTPVFTSLDKVKFRGMVKPGDTLETECELVRQRGMFYFAKGTGRVNGKVCVSAEFSFALVKA